MNEKKGIILEIKRKLYSKSLYEFTKEAVKILEPSTKWSFNFHHKYICEVLQDEFDRINNNLPRENDIIINLPFRSMKSLIVSVCYPIWCWINKPDMKIMVISYAENLSVKQAYFSKIIMGSSWFKQLYPNIKLMPDDNQKGSYTNVYGGRRESFGMNGSITGSGADIIIIDDPNKAGEGKKVIQNTNDVYDDRIFNRLNNPEVGLRLIIQQRVNQNDLSGHLLSKDGGEYFHINIPAENNGNVKPIELIEYYEDGLFWKHRFSYKILNQYKVSLGSIGYATQLLQETSTDGGNIFKEKWFKVINWDENLYKNIKWDLFVDTAYTSKSSNDATAILMCAMHQNNLLIRKVWELRLEFPELIKDISSISKDYNINQIFIEPKANGLSVIQQLRRETKLSIVKLPSPKEDKETRANTIAPQVEAERVILFEDNWNKLFLSQVTNFPLITNDDILDVFVYAVKKHLVKDKVIHYRM